MRHWEVEPDRIAGLILRHKPAIVHFGGPWLSTGEGGDVGAIAEMFNILRKYVRCVVLSA